MRFAPRGGPFVASVYPPMKWEQLKHTDLYTSLAFLRVTCRRERQRQLNQLQPWEREVWQALGRPGPGVGSGHHFLLPLR